MQLSTLHLRSETNSGSSSVQATLRSLTTFKPVRALVDIYTSCLVDQKTVTTSSTKAELLALTYATKETIWWRCFFKHIGFDPGHELTVHCDNLQTIRLLTKENQKLATKLRHIDIHQHWLRQEVQAGRVRIKWLPTNEMLADGLTKALPRQRHEHFIKQLNLVDIAARLTT
jgi:hypothetical protein